ncbi:hypothetical protein DICPUDRAFT_97090 [Dictyostelium purpureum]|uniref:Uncharacterized protein n=1 Tax=Dictyostelium purpureum TaxID=5786 RepID=F0ZDS9_DICPU|nr:uncharacterized protein DICPUDRAFT_97090 [Dictyostelium purpureum]EGC37900.1 hypothetical protein DICPUDRAFT_97090 [Dictyostelium purpureum]|eukprot:XP_003285560.1 hypothetical protein DICPUDRAFT_97090 [Dictyostelium purpureum]
MSPRPESIKKVMDVLGDFNPSEDKIKKTLGIDEDELRQINEEKQTISSPKDRIPINRKLTKKAQDTLGINLSREKLMDVFGVDEDTINWAESEESEHKENLIKKSRENIVSSNKRTLQKALSKMGIDPSNHKIARTLGVSEELLNHGVLKPQPSSWSPAYALFFITLFILAVTFYLIIQQKQNFLDLKTLLDQQNQFINNNHHRHNSNFNNHH